MLLPSPNSGADLHGEAEHPVAEPEDRSAGDEDQGLRAAASATKVFVIIDRVGLESTAAS